MQTREPPYLRPLEHDAASLTDASPGKPSNFRHRRAVTVALSCAAALAACGSSSQPSATGRSGDSTALVKFSECMRSHGVPNYPDPTPGVDLVKLLTKRGVNPASPAFQSGQTVCSRLLPGGGGPGSTPPSAQDLAQAFRISKCMRQHGVSEFPDPTLALPSNQAGYDVIDRGGVFLTFPNTISTASPAFEQAATACRLPH